MSFHSYLMEGDEEAIRLDLKTNINVVKNQALWAGLKPGMRVADLGCGSGKTTMELSRLVKPNGSALGVDFSEQRIAFANNNYHHAHLEFCQQDIREPLSNLGAFDFIWIRFVLEYYRKNNFDILRNVFRILKPGGILCLIDLDHNCLNYHGISSRLDNTIRDLIKIAEKEYNFDPYAGRKLYTHLFDLGCQDIDVSVNPHHLIFGKMNNNDNYNFMKKIEAASKVASYAFENYSGGHSEFADEFKKAFTNYRRFFYTPVICAKGRKPEKVLSRA